MQLMTLDAKEIKKKLSASLRSANGSQQRLKAVPHFATAPSSALHLAVESLCAPTPASAVVMAFQWRRFQFFDKVRAMAAAAAVAVQRRRPEKSERMQ